jgi:AraC family transcriptional activator of pobA
MIKDRFVLIDSETGELALGISSFVNGNAFSKPQRLNYFSLLLVTEGKGILARDHTTYNFDAGCLLCFSLYQSFTVLPENSFAGILINFHPGFFCLYRHRNEVSCNGVLFNNLYDSPVTVLKDDAMRSLQIIARQLMDELGRQRPDQDLLLSYLKIFLVESSRTKMAQREAAYAGDEKKPALLDELQQLIDVQYKTLKSPGAYAKQLHISEKSLNKICKQHFNKTLTNLIAERLTIEAKRELYLTAKPVKQIAFELGYNDEFYFSRFFKKQAGVSPQIFRDRVGFNKITGT